MGAVVVAALIDTGSTASVISETFDKKIPQVATKETNFLNFNLVTACGDPMRKLETVEVSVKLHSVDHNPIKNSFHVKPNLETHCILGMDFISSMQ